MKPIFVLFIENSIAQAEIHGTLGTHRRKSETFKKNAIKSCDASLDEIGKPCYELIYEPTPVVVYGKIFFFIFTKVVASCHIASIL